MDGADGKMVVGYLHLASVAPHFPQRRSLCVVRLMDGHFIGGDDIHPVAAALHPGRLSACPMEMDSTIHAG